MDRQGVLLLVAESESKAGFLWLKRVSDFLGFVLSVSCLPSTMSHCLSCEQTKNKKYGL
jgi:hypothetical protein